MHHADGLFAGRARRKGEESKSAHVTQRLDRAKLGKVVADRFRRGGGQQVANVDGGIFLCGNKVQGKARRARTPQG